VHKFVNEMKYERLGFQGRASSITFLIHVEHPTSWVQSPKYMYQRMRVTSQELVITYAYVRLYLHLVSMFVMIVLIVNVINVTTGVRPII
jgi:hypothetical protein